jgi:hypothetical protein
MVIFRLNHCLKIWPRKEEKLATAIFSKMCCRNATRPGAAGQRCADA